MYLEKLEIQGFKSFANKNHLIFSGLIGDQRRGLTAIVGPNGSGKSNVADAIRWALGEQSMKTLRGKKSEDIIFSGSDQKNQLGFAEVSLYLNNAEAAKNKEVQEIVIESEKDLDQMILSCPEISLTRRLYRNGDSEYLINNSRARLTDIQMLLAKAKFGQKTYSVIGQGMVENFLNTSAAERKDFFDEATGVKQFQLKRDSALNKLENSYENLQQVEMLLAEIRPRLKSLTRSVEKLNRRSQIETELKDRQLNYYYHIWKEINERLDGYNSSYLEKEKVKIDRDKKIAKLNDDLNKIKKTDNSQARNELQPRLQELYNSKNQLHKQLAKFQAELEMGLEAQGKFDLSWLNSKRVELAAELEKAEKELAVLVPEQVSGEEKELTEKLARLNQKLEEANRRLRTLSNELGGSRREQTREEVNKIITDFLSRLEEISAEENLEEIKKSLRHAQENFKNKIKDFLTAGDENQLLAIKDVQEKIITLNEEKQEIGATLGDCRWRLTSRQEKYNLWREKKGQIERELDDVKNKIDRQATPADKDKTAVGRKEAEKSLDNINQQIKDLEKQAAELNSAKDQEKSLIFDCQRNLQAVQREVDLLNIELNELKVNAARQETRLEDLENNIRNDGLNLLEIKDGEGKIATDADGFDQEKMIRRISELKNQLDQIGGIDPETEKEYSETKERYDFLSGQTTDLNNAVKSLEEIIYELDLNIKTRFDAEFKVISEKFNEYFKILFNGGTAKISKVMIEDLEKESSKNGPAGNKDANDENEFAATTAGGLTAAEAKIKSESDDKLKKIKFLKKHNAVGLAGIEIQATPPGKRIQVVTMLSGGERALTAIALISAIISANPSPFVVLDEVDAALDEANSERLAKILDDLSNKTQFIVITHNRASMRRASILYGVTMESDGVSKLLSVKLDELKK